MMFVLYSIVLLTMFTGSLHFHEIFRSVVLSLRLQRSLLRFLVLFSNETRVISD